MLSTRAGTIKTSDWGKGTYFDATPDGADYYRKQALRQTDTAYKQAADRFMEASNGGEITTPETQALLQKMREAGQAIDSGTSGRVIEARLKPGAKVLDYEPTGYGVDQSLSETAAKQGYDAVRITDGNGKTDEMLVINPDAVYTKQQLTDLYNQATKPERFNELVPKSYLEPDAPKGKLTAKEKAMGKALGLSEADTLAAKQGGTGLDRTVNLDGSPIIPKAPKGQVKRGFVQSLQDDWGVPSKVSDQLPQGYKPIKNADTFAQAKQIVDSDPASLQRLLSKPKSAITELDQAQLQIHLRKAIEGDNFDSAKRIATKIDVNARQAGRTVQILAAWKKTTPEGALSHAYKVVEEANTKYPGKNFEVTPEKAKNIRRLAENIQKTTAGTRERQVAQRWPI